MRLSILPLAYELAGRLGRAAPIIFGSYSARTVLACTVTLWLLSFAICKKTLWRDPHTAFFREDGAYGRHYSIFRQAEARLFIEEAQAGSQSSNANRTRAAPVICAAITTFKRDGVQYLNDTVGSMLAGLSDEERSVLDVYVLFAHVDSTVHPNWNAKWLDTVDHWAGYNVSEEQLKHIQELETTENFYEKGIFDYVYVLRDCLTRTDAPYIAIFEDDLMFAEGWLVKTLDGLAELRQRSKPWLYMRLFYTETSLGWHASEDFWYDHMAFTFALAMGVVLTFLLFVKGVCRLFKRPYRYLDIASVMVLVLITTPAFTALVFMAGKHNIKPLNGVERMDKHGCCTQALIFPRYQAQALIDFLTTRGSGQTDSLIEEYAETFGHDRYALAPQVVQHVGSVSSHKNLPINTQSTWAFWFEAQDSAKLKKEHAKLLRSSIWRATGDGS